MGTTVPGAEPDANIDHEISSRTSIDSGMLEITRRLEVAASAAAARTDLGNRLLAAHRPVRVVARPPQTGAPASPLEVYAAITSAIAAGCVPPPRVVLRQLAGLRVVELEFPQSHPDGRGAVDSWAAEFDAIPGEATGVIAVRYGFEPSECRDQLVAGWELRVFTHLDLPPTLGGVTRAAGVWREDQPQGAGPATAPGGCPTDGRAPTTSSPVGLEGARPGPDSGASQGAAVGGGTADDQTPVVVLASRRGALGAAAHTNPLGGEPA